MSMPMVLAFTIFIGPVNNSVRPTELSNLLARKVLITRDNGALTVDVPFNGNHVVELLSAQGKVITRRTGSNAAQYRIMPDRHTPALYIVRVKADGRKPVVQKMML